LRDYGRAAISANSFCSARNQVDSQFGHGPGAVQTLDEVEQRVGPHGSIIVDSCIKVPETNDPIWSGFAGACREKSVPIFRRFRSQGESIWFARCERGSTEGGPATNTDCAQAFG
jgi:hypothetical protein